MSADTAQQLDNQINLLIEQLPKIQDDLQRSQIALTVAQAIKQLEEAREVQRSADRPTSSRNSQILVGTIIAVAAVAGYFLTTLQPILKDIAAAAQYTAAAKQAQLDKQKQDQFWLQDRLDQQERELENLRAQVSISNEGVSKQASNITELVSKTENELRVARGEQPSLSPVIDRLLGDLQGVSGTTQMIEAQSQARRPDFVRNVTEADPEIPGTSDARLDSYPQTSPEDPRGIRNNNPVLVARDKWVGLMPAEDLTPEQLAEKKFAVFRHPAYGFRAGARVILRQQKEAGQPISVSKQLFIWFGDTPALRIASERVADRLGVGPGDPVDLVDRTRISEFLTELAKFHNGLSELPYDNSVIEDGLTLADLANAA